MGDQAESVVGATIGLDPNKTILWAQVREGQPQMSIDIEGRLRPAVGSGSHFQHLELLRDVRTREARRKRPVACGASMPTLIAWGAVLVVV